MAGGMLKAVGPKALDVMVTHNYHTIDTIFYSIQHRPNYERDTPHLSKEEIEKMEAMRRQLPKMVLPVLGMVRKLAERFPPETVEAKVTREWLLKRAERSQPEVAGLLKGYGEQGEKWLEEEAKQIRLYLLGRLVWDPASRHMVEVKPSG